MEEQKKIEENKISNLEKDIDFNFNQAKEINYKKKYPDNKGVFYYPLKKNFISIEEEKKYNHYYGEEFVDRISRIDKLNKKESYLQDDIVTNLIFLYLISSKSNDYELLRAIKSILKIKNFTKNDIIKRIKILYDRYHGFLDEGKSQFWYMSCKKYEKKNILTLFQNNKQLFCNIDNIYDCSLHSNIDPNFDNPSCYNQIDYLKSYKKLLEYSINYLYGGNSCENVNNNNNDDNMIIDNPNENENNDESYPLSVSHNDDKKNKEAGNNIINNLNNEDGNNNVNNNINNDLLSNASSKIQSSNNTKENKENNTEIILENKDGSINKIISLLRKKEEENINNIGSNNNINNNNISNNNISNVNLSNNNISDSKESNNNISNNNMLNNIPINNISNNNFDNEVFRNHIIDLILEFNQTLKNLKCQSNLVSQLKKVKYMLKEDRKPCSELCYKNLLSCEEKLYNQSYLDLKDKQFPEVFELLFIIFLQKVKFDPCRIYKLMKPFINPKDPENNINFTLNCSDIYIHLLTQKFSLKIIIKKELFDLNIKERELSKKNRTSLNPIQSKRYEENKRNLTYIPCIHFGNEICDEKCLCSKRGSCEIYCRCNQILCKYAYHGCHCSKGDCTTNHCPCYVNGRECNPLICKNCDRALNSNDRCKNMQLQQDYESKLIVGISNIAGWGLFAKEDIKKDNLIGEYKGELINDDIVNKRDRFKDYDRSTYMFKLDDEYTVDSRKMGNMLRYANHSKINANAYPKIIFSGGHRKIGLFAKKNIRKGEEILFDYDGQGILGKQFSWINNEKKFINHNFNNVKSISSSISNSKSVNNNINNSNYNINKNEKISILSNIDLDNNNIISNNINNNSINYNENNKGNNSFNNNSHRKRKIKIKKIRGLRYKLANSSFSKEKGKIGKIDNLILEKEEKGINKKDNIIIEDSTIKNNINIKDNNIKNNIIIKDNNIFKDNTVNKGNYIKENIFNSFNKNNKNNIIKDNNIKNNNLFDNPNKNKNNNIINIIESPNKKSILEKPIIENNNFNISESKKDVAHTQPNLIDMLSDKNFCTNKINSKRLFKTEEDEIKNIKNNYEKGKENNIFDIMLKIKENLTKNVNVRFLSKKRIEPKFENKFQTNTINPNINNNSINNNNINISNNIIKNENNENSDNTIIDNVFIKNQNLQSPLLKEVKKFIDKKDEIQNEKEMKINIEINKEDNEFKLKKPIFAGEMRDNNLNSTNDYLKINKISYNFIKVEYLNNPITNQIKQDFSNNIIINNNSSLRMNEIPNTNTNFVFINNNNQTNKNMNIFNNTFNNINNYNNPQNKNKIANTIFNLGIIRLLLNFDNPIINDFYFYSPISSEKLKHIEKLEIEPLNLTNSSLKIDFDKDICGYLAKTLANKGPRIFKDYLDCFENTSYHCNIPEINSELFIISKGPYYTQIENKYDFNNGKNKKLLFILKNK